MSRRRDDLDDSYAAALGRAIKVLRTDIGMGRSELAEAAGVSYPYLSEIENGKKRPSDRTLHSIARALGIRTHELVEMAELRAERSTLAIAFDADESLPMAPMGAEPRSEHLMQMLRSPALERPRTRPIADALRELEQLLSEMRPDDVERILDLARRLVR